MSKQASSVAWLSYVLLLTFASQSSGCATVPIGAAGGAATSGIAYLVTLGSPSPSQSIWTASVDGDYVVTPRMIEGRDDVDFVGG
jgi:hypothetical protein